MPKRSSHPFDVLVGRFAQLFAERISAALPGPPRRGGTRNGAESKLRGRKLDMRCHYPGCKNRSKGPRFRFLCEEHLKLSKREQIVALETWRNGGRARTRTRSISRQRRALRLAD